MKHIRTAGVAGTNGSQKAFKAIALLLVFCVADFCVLADSRATHFEVSRAVTTKSNASTGDTETITPVRRVVFGRLEVPYRQTILVNGHRGESGETITSGSRLQTSFIKATVQIGSIGELDIAPDTDLLLTFDQRSVEVQVAAGDAILSTDDGVKGQVMMPDGKTYPPTALPKKGGSGKGGPGDWFRDHWRDIVDGVLTFFALRSLGGDAKECFLDIPPASASPITSPTSLPWPCHGFPKGTHFRVS